MIFWSMKNHETMITLMLSNNKLTYLPCKLKHLLHLVFLIIFPFIQKTQNPLKRLKVILNTYFYPPYLCYLYLNIFCLSISNEDPNSNCIYLEMLLYDIQTISMLLLKTLLIYRKALTAIHER